MRRLSHLLHSLCLCVLAAPLLSAEVIEVEREGLPGVSDFVVDGSSFYVRFAMPCPNSEDGEATMIASGNLDDGLSGAVFASIDSLSAEDCTPYEVGSELLVDDTYLYWVTAEGLIRNPLTLLPVQLTDPGQRELLDVVPEGGIPQQVAQVGKEHLPVLEAISPPRLQRLPQPGEKKEPLREINPTPDESEVEIPDRSEILSSKLPMPYGDVELAQNETNVFLLFPSTNTSTLYRVRKADGFTTKLKIIAGSAADLQFDGAHLYWLVDGRLYRLQGASADTNPQELDADSDPITAYHVESALGEGKTTRRFVARGAVVSFVLENEQGNTQERLVLLADPAAQLVGLELHDSLLFAVEQLWDDSCERCSIDAPWRFRFLLVERLSGDTTPLEFAQTHTETPEPPTFKVSADGFFFERDGELHHREFCRDCIENDRRERGDVNGDLTTDLSDGQSLLTWLFLGGEAPACPASADTNGDEALDLADASYLLSHLFLGGPAPEAGLVACVTVPEDGSRRVAELAEPAEPSPPNRVILKRVLLD